MRNCTCATSACHGTGTSVPGMGMQGRSASPSSNPRPVASLVPPSMSSAYIEPGSGMPLLNTRAIPSRSMRLPRSTVFRSFTKASKNRTVG